MSCVSHACHMTITLIHASHMTITLIHASHMIYMNVTCQSHACHMSVTCSHMHVTCMSHSPLRYTDNNEQIVLKFTGPPTPDCRETSRVSIIMAEGISGLRLSTYVCAHVLREHHLAPGASGGGHRVAWFICVVSRDLQSQGLPLYLQLVHALRLQAEVSGK